MIGRYFDTPVLDGNDRLGRLWDVAEPIGLFSPPRSYDEGAGRAVVTNDLKNVLVWQPCPASDVVSNRNRSPSNQPRRAR
jgi:hypothetical protein